MFVTLALIHLRNKHCADLQKRAIQAILDCTSEERFVKQCVSHRLTIFKNNSSTDNPSYLRLFL